MKPSTSSGLNCCPGNSSGSGNLKHRPQWWRKACAALSVAAFALCATNASAINWIDADLGGPQFAGSTVTNSPGNYDIIGGGSDIWNSTSQCHYRYAWAQGTNWDMSFQCTGITGVGNDGTWTKCELMVVNASTTVGPVGNDPFISDMICLPTGTHSSYGEDQYRTTKNSGSDGAGLGTHPTDFTGGCWVQVSRRGNVFEINYGQDGIHWTNYINIDTASNASLGGGSSTVFGTAWPDVVAVGIAVTAHNDGPAIFADATVQNVTANFAAITPPTVAGPSVQVTNVATHVGSEASFSFVTTNNASPNVVIPSYQWYKNGLPVTNVTALSYTFLATAADNNATVYCVATIPPPYNGTVSTITSATGTLTVASSIVKNGFLKREFFPNNDSRTSIEQGNTPPAQAVTVRPNFDDPGGYGSDYIQRVSGLFIPPTSGSYVFFVASDDDSDIYLSTDNNAANKVLICQETAWSGFDNWVASDSNSVAGNGGGVWSQQRSDTWSPDGGTTVPWALGIPLLAGTNYYIEGVMHQGGGGDDFSVTYKNLTGGVDPTNNQISMLTASNNNIALMSYPDSTPVWTVQPTNTIITQFTPGGLHVKALSGGEFPPAYQWYSNNVPMIGQTGPDLTWNSTPGSINGATFYCVATGVMNGLSSTSASAIINVAAPVFEQGWTSVAYWYSTTAMASLTNGTIGAPDHIITSPTMEQASANNEAGDNFLSQMTTLFVPPTSGLYDFYVNSDDDSDLFVSTDSTAANKRLVAQETGWSNPWTWNGSGSGGPVGMKQSASWSPDGGTTTPWASGISLVAGQSYYIELDHHEGGGGDNSEATYTLHGVGAPANNTVSAMTGNQIGIFVPRAFSCNFTLQPTNETAVAYGSLTFAAASTSSSTVAVGDTGDPRPKWGNTTFYQWYRNGQPVAGATASTFTISPVVPNDTNVFCATRCLGFTDNSGNHLWVTGQVATVTVTGVVAPHMTYAGFYANNNYLPWGGSVTNYITVQFDTPMNLAALANPANYTVGGGVSILGVVVSADGKSVSLMVSGVPTFPLTVSVSPSLSGLGGGLAVANTSTNVTGPAALTDIDIGNLSIDPAVPGTMIVDGPNAYTIYAEGSDIWGAADGFNFAYELKTNNFDVVVRVISNKNTSTFAKAGLMIREDLTPGSRNWSIVNDPATGNNQVECNVRYTTDTANNTGFDITSRAIPAYPNAWVRLTRTLNGTNDICLGYTSTNGVDWNLQASNNMALFGNFTNMPPVVYVGLCTSAHNNDGIPNPATLLFLNESVYDSYNSNFVPGNPTLHATVSGGNITVTWTPNIGRLLASPALTGPSAVWTQVGTGGSVTLPATNGASFFKVINP